MHALRGYTSDGERALSLSELLRLLVLGGKLQVEACVAQCVDKVKEALDVDGKDPGAAMEVLESVPSEMDGRKDVEALRNQAFLFLLMAMIVKRVAPAEVGRAWGIVVSFIEERAEGRSMVEGDAWGALETLLSVNSPGEEVKGKVAAAVARYLGPVHRLWAAGPWQRRCWSQGLSAKVRVSPYPPPIEPRPLRLKGYLGCQDLPMEVLELALKSDALQLASENDAYALVGGWVAHCPAANRQRDFNRLVKCLRLHHMSAAFLTSVVIRSKFRDGCPYLLEACTNALMYQSIASTLSSQVPLSQQYMASCKPRRSPAASKYEFEAQVQLADCLALDDQNHKSITTRLGVAEGYVIKLSVKKSTRTDGDTALGLFVGLRRPDTGAEHHEQGATVGSTGPILRMQVAVNGEPVMDFRSLCRAKHDARGVADPFGKRWGEVVREGSDYFPQGRMVVKVKARFISDRHQEGEPSSDEDEDED
jgi:hypothetical protein